MNTPFHKKPKQPKFYCGVDIGGTKIKAVLIGGFSISPIRKIVVDTPRERKKFFDAIRIIVGNIAAEKKLSGIGVGTAGVVDPKRGVLLKAAHLPFLDGWSAKNFFGKYAPHVALDNDSRCMLRAEAAWGVAKGHKNIVGIAIGTGIGGGMMIDGKMYYGSTNAAGEFGHMIMQVKSEKLKDKNKEFEALAGKRAYEKYGDRSEIIGIGAANLINAFDPDMVVLGGGGIVTGAARIDKIRRSARQYLISPLARKTPIVRGKLGGYAGAVGAALLLGIHSTKID